MTTPAHNDRRRYLVRHVTTYSYDAECVAAYERGRLRPRETPYQQVLETGLHIDPEPGTLTEHRDHFGNHSHYFEVRTPHRRLEIRAETTVEIEWPAPDLAALDRWTVESAAAQLRETGDPVAVTNFLLPSLLVEYEEDGVAEYAASILAPDRPLGEAVADLYHRIYTDFDYRSGVTSTRTTLPEVLELRAGVCQDFAHLAVGCLRSVGLPGRYVSGYLETLPPPGQEKLEGSDASHAWASVLTPEHGWIDHDPTNDQFADSRYVVTGWGRDFNDVSPLRGSVFGEWESSELDVGVDTIRLDKAEQEPPAR